MELTRSVSALPRGTALSRFIMALASSRDKSAQIAYAEEHFKNTPQVAMTLRAMVSPGSLTDGSFGAPLAAYGIAAEALEALRAATVLDQLAPSMRRLPFRTKVARETSVAASSWVGEALPTPARAAAFNMVQQEVYKSGTIVVMTDALVRYSHPSAEADLRNQLVKGVTRFLDSQLLDSTVGPTAYRSGSLTHNATAVSSSGSSAAQILADLLSMAEVLTDANTVPSHWIMRPATAISLAGKYNTAGALAFPYITATGGTLLGIPVLTSNSSPQQITLLDASQILLSDDGRLDLQSTQEAALQMLDDPITGATSLVSLFQNDMFGLRFIRELAYQPAHETQGSPNFNAGVSYMTVSY